MIYTRGNDHYDVRLSNNLLKACENGTADFLNPMTVPYYTQDMFSKQVLNDAAQLQTLLNNSMHGTQYINYAPTYVIQDSKSEWMKNIDKDDREIGCITYKGRDENGNKRYEMMSPAGKFNPGSINENPMTQNPVPNVGVYRQTPTLDSNDSKGIEKYVTDVIGNYFNAAFTKTPYFPPQWGGHETEMLSKAINADPSLAIRAAKQAFSQATSVKLENTVNHELNENVKEAIKQGFPPFNTKKQNTIIGPVNVNGSGIPTNGVDFINSIYDGIKGKNGAEKGNTAQNGYIPYQTHNENPKNIDKFLIEEYGNLMNASLTGTPYSGSIHHAQLKNLAAGIEAKIANNPAFMSEIVNQAQQNVLGCNYMPYDKDAFISKAQDPTSKEFKLLDQMVASHVKDICMKNKQSFNGEFQELSKDLAENLKNTVTTNSAKRASPKTNTAKNSENPSLNTSTIKQNENPAVNRSHEVKQERPSFLREVTNFVSKHIVEKKTALVLVDTFLGAVVDKARRIVFSGPKHPSSAFAIAKNAVAPGVQMQTAKTPVANKVSTSVGRNASKLAANSNVKTTAAKTTAAKTTTVKQTTAKKDELVRQKQQTRTSARR